MTKMTYQLDANINDYDDYDWYEAKQKELKENNVEMLKMIDQIDYTIQEYIKERYEEPYWEEVAESICYVHASDIYEEVNHILELREDHCFISSFWAIYFDYDKYINDQLLCGEWVAYEDFYILNPYLFA